MLSFNQSGLPTAWTGFSTEWYGKLAGNTAVLRATLNSLIVAAAATLSPPSSAPPWRSASRHAARPARSSMR